MWTSRDQPRRSHPSFLLRRQDSSDKYDEVHQKSLTNLTPILKKINLVYSLSNTYGGSEENWQSIMRFLSCNAPKLGNVANDCTMAVQTKLGLHITQIYFSVQILSHQQLDIANPAKARPRNRQQCQRPLCSLPIIVILSTYFHSKTHSWHQLPPQRLCPYTEMLCVAA